MNSTVYVVSKGSAIQPALGFYAKSAQVDNLGGQWVYFPDANITVPPFTTNAIVSFPATQTPRVLDNPPGTQKSTGAGSPANIIFSDNETQSSPGIPIQGTNAPVISTAFSQAGIGGVTFSDLFVPIPAGQHILYAASAVVFIANGSTTLQWTLQILLNGYASNISYGSHTPDNANLDAFIPSSTGLPFVSDGSTGRVAGCIWFRCSTSTGLTFPANSVLSGVAMFQ